MEPLESFWSFLNKFVPLTPDEFQAHIVPFVELRTYRKKEVITRSGEIENFINFIGKGLARKYFVHEGNEIITQIAKEGQIIHAQESFFSRKPSQYVVEAIEPTTLLSISCENLEKIYAASAAMERMGRLIVTFIMVVSDRWQMSLLKLSPRERFLQFVQKNSELMQRVPQKYLASLLNIQPETFSRFKHLLRNLPITQDVTTTSPSGE